MDPEERKQRIETELEMARRELARMSMDTIRVYNPLDTTFSFMYDRYWHRVPAKSEKDFPRYLAMHFFKKIADEIIGNKIQLEGKELKARREKALGQEFKDPYEENVQVWDKMPKLNDPTLLNEIKRTVIVGMVEEYGMDEIPEEKVVEGPVDQRSIHEQLFDDINQVTISKDTPLRENKATLEKEIKADK